MNLPGGGSFLIKFILSIIKIGTYKKFKAAHVNEIVLSNEREDIISTIAVEI